MEIWAETLASDLIQLNKMDLLLYLIIELRSFDCKRVYCSMAVISNSVLVALYHARGRYGLPVSLRIVVETLLKSVASRNDRLILQVLG